MGWNDKGGAKRADDKNEQPASDKAADKPEPAAPAVAKAPPHQPAPAPAPVPATTGTVAKDKSVVCLKGIIDAGETIKAEYLSGGQESFAELVAGGVVVPS